MKLRRRRNFQLIVVIHNMCVVFIFIEDIGVTAYHLGIQDFQSPGTVAKLGIFFTSGLAADGRITEKVRCMATWDICIVLCRHAGHRHCPT